MSQAIALLNEALAKARGGDLTGGSSLVDRALSLEPKNPAVLYGRAILYRVEGRLGDAVRACDAALAIAPHYAEAWLEKGTILASGGSPRAARKCFEKAASLAPGNAAAHAQIAVMAAREREFDVVRKSAGAALAIDPHNIDASNALAAAMLDEGKIDGAADLLAPLIEKVAAGSSRSKAFSLLAAASEKAGDHAAAYDWLVRANEDFLRASAAMAQNRPGNTAIVEAIRQGIEGVADWTTPIGLQNDFARSVFLIGYPRSGTTLTENILASIDGVAALEERPTFMGADSEFLLCPPEEIPASLQRFSEQDAAQLERLRQAYWDKVFASGIDRGTEHFVDMDPLKATRLPFIARMFPEARIIFMRRDPRDVVWSCFRTNFALSSAALEFTTLERTAQHYDAMMRLSESARERLDLPCHDLRYEGLVTDFDGTTRELCEFLGIDWSDAVGRFADTAHRRGVATASSGQIGKGLYDGRGQWKPYARWMEAVMPILQPWIDRFGYA